MSGFLRVAGTVASVASVALMFVPGGQVVAGIAKAATLLKIAQGAALAANLGAALTAKKPSNQRQGQQLQFKISPGGPIPIVVGRTAVSGTIAYHDVYGTQNSYQTYAVALSFGLRNQIETFTADKVAVPRAGTGVTGYYANWMWLDFQGGATPEDALVNGITAPPYGTAGPMPGWGASYKMSGYTASTLSELFDTKARRYASGEPEPAWIVGNPVCYDPRLDNTYPGGSGPHRWADPKDRAAHQAARATWTATDTPAIVSLMWRLGIWLCDESDPAAAYKRVAGIGAPIDLVDMARIVEAANVQEAAGFKVGGQIDTSMDKWTVLKMIDEAGAAEPVANGSLLSIFQQMPRVPLATITAAGLADGAITAPGMVSRKNKLNGYRARFMSEPHGWQMTDINIVQVPDYVAADGRETTSSGDFNLVQDADQCATLAAYKVFDSRELTRSLPLKPMWSGYRIGDCLALNMPEIGLIETDVVRGRQLSPATTVTTLALRTESVGKHAAALGQTATVPPTPSLTTISDEIGAPVSSEWTLAGATFTDNGVSIPALVITGALGNAKADGVVFDFRPYATGAGPAAGWSAASIDAPETTRKEITGVTPGTQYEVGIRYRVRGAIGDRLILGPVTAGDFTVGPDPAVEQLVIANSYPVGISIIGTDAGGSASVVISSHTRRYSDKDVAVGTVTLAGLLNATTYYFYYDDAARAGGAKDIIATTNYPDAFNSSATPARHYVGVVATPTSGGGDSGGGGGTPPGGGGYNPNIVLS